MTRQPGAPFDSKREEVFHIAGDVPDPMGQTGHGYMTRLKLDKDKTVVQVRYKDFLSDCDLYRLEGAPMRLLLICPRCRNTLTITSDKKQMDYDPGKLPQFGGALSVEAFQCTWELDSTPDGRRMEFGLSLCKWRVAIDANVAKPA